MSWSRHPGFLHFGVRTELQDKCSHPVTLAMTVLYCITIDWHTCYSTWLLHHLAPRLLPLTLNEHTTICPLCLVTKSNLQALGKAKSTLAMSQLKGLPLPVAFKALLQMHCSTYWNTMESKMFLNGWMMSSCSDSHPLPPLTPMLPDISFMHTTSTLSFGSQTHWAFHGTLFSQRPRLQIFCCVCRFFCGTCQVTMSPCWRRSTPNF